VRVAVLLLVASVVALLGISPPAHVGGPQLPRVTVIGDSVATSLDGEPTATAILGQGVDLRLELAPCRRVGQSSCPYDGVRPPNVIDLVNGLGSALGPTVIVSVGYNDYVDEYARNIEDALAALAHAGVKNVLWATLRAVHHDYLTMNDAIEGAAAHHPELTVVDWNMYSRSHPDWFQPDGLHLTGAGAIGMATLFHQALEDLHIPVETAPTPPLRIVTSKLPVARTLRTYAAALTANGGSAPYRWSRGTAFPRWLRLSPNGRLTGTAPARPASVSVKILVADAAGTVARRRFTLLIRR